MSTFFLILIITTIFILGFFFFLFVKKKMPFINVSFYLVWFLVIISILVATEKDSFFNENIISTFALLFFVWLTLLPTLLYAIVIKKTQQKLISIKYFYIPIALFLINFFSLLFFYFSEDSKSFANEFIENIVTYSNYFVMFFVFPISTIYYVIKSINEVITKNKNQSILNRFKLPEFLFILVYFIFIFSFLINYIFPNIIIKGILFSYFPLSAFFLFKLNKINSTENLDTLDATFISINENLISALENDLIYLNQDINIKEFAKTIGTNEKYLSQLINKKYKTSYSNFINKYRVEHAKKMLLNNEYDNYTIQSIGIMSGFKSKSSFNLTFKKISGITPTEFKMSKGAK
jgi:AraC-like DNA-binding protein